MMLPHLTDIYNAAMATQRSPAITPISAAPPFDWESMSTVAPTKIVDLIAAVKDHHPASNCICAIPMRNPCARG